MKIAFIFLFLLHFAALGQCDSTDAVHYPDEEAQFPGGVASMMKFINENMVYPNIEREGFGPDCILIYVQFIVCTDGSINTIEVFKSNNDFFNQASLDLITKMPNWIPAKNNDIPVVSLVRLPIRINLQ